MDKNDEGRKYDAGKAEYGLIPPHSLEELAKVLTFGARKYDRDNWKKVPDAKYRYFNAMQRHLWAWKRGETIDPESGLHHLAHAICCAMFLSEFELDPTLQEPEKAEQKHVWDPTPRPKQNEPIAPAPAPDTQHPVYARRGAVNPWPEFWAEDIKPVTAPTPHVSPYSE